MPNKRPLNLFLLILLKVPALLYLGACIMGYTAAQLMTEDLKFGHYLAPFAEPLEIIFVLGVWGLGWYLTHKKA